MTREEFAAALDDAIDVTHMWLDLADVADEDNALYEAYDDRFHCSACLLAGILDIIWPVCERYINELEDRLNPTGDTPHD